MEILNDCELIVSMSLDKAENLKLFYYSIYFWYYL